MSVHQNNLGSTIQQYQAQRNTCEAESQKLATEVAVLQNNYDQLLAAAREKFGTDDPAMLNNMLINLTTESEALQAELNNLNAGANGMVGNANMVAQNMAYTQGR